MSEKLSNPWQLVSLLLVGLIVGYGMSGSVFLLTYFEPLRAYVGVMAIALLLLAIILKRRKDTCEKGCH